MPVPSFCFVEQSALILRLVRCERHERTLHIESMQELLPSESGVAEALKAFASLPGATFWCAIRPKGQRVHFATAADAKQHAGPAGVAQLLQKAGAPASAFAAVDAATGRMPTAERWLALACSPEELTAALSSFGTAAAPRSIAATFTAAGALAAGADRPVLLLELGDTTSLALVVDRSGVRSTASLTLGRMAIAEAVQAELGLKFRGAAEKLFFNPDYDFTDIAAGVAGRLAGPLKAELSALELKPTALFCGTLGAHQHWLAAQLGSALALEPFVPDPGKWCSANGLKFATPALEQAVTPAWLPTFSCLHAHTLATATPGPWQAEWHAPGIPAAAPVPVRPVPAEVVAPKPAVKTAAPAQPALKPAAAVSDQRPQPSVTPTVNRPVAPAPAASAIAGSATIPAKPVVAESSQPKAAGGKKPATPPFPLVQPTSAGPGASSSVAYPAKAPASAKSPTATEVKTTSTAARPPAATPTAPAAKSAGAKRFLLPAAALVIVVLLIAGFVGWSQQKEAKLAAEKQQTEERLKAEQQRSQLAEQKAREAAEAREKTEREFSQKLSVAEMARQQAEKEAQSQTAARLANARGTVQIVTEPAGATVTVGNLPPRSSPATFTDIKTGRYPVTIALAGYDDARLELEVRENATTDPGAIKLVRATGTLEITTDPTGVAYELQPANALMLMPDARRSGRTPARFDDLTPGAYTLTLTRTGWAPHTETVSVARGETARVDWRLPTGLIKLTSSPSGATVRRNGVDVGSTPLELGDQPTGAVEFVVSRADYQQPVTVRGEVAGGSVLALAAVFPAHDRIYAPGELDSNPEPMNDKPPTLPYYLTLEKGRIEIELIVLRDGSSTGYRVLQTTNPDYTRFCFDALKKWRFRPAVAQGQPVNARLVVPFTFKATKS